MHVVMAGLSARACVSLWANARVSKGIPSAAMGWTFTMVDIDRAMPVRRRTPVPSFRGLLRVAGMGYCSGMLASKRWRQTFHLREYRRFPMQCLVYFSSETLTGTGSLWNLSRGGWRMDSEIPLPCGTVLRLLVMLPEMNHGLVVEQATVCWSRGGHEVGLGTQTIDALEAARLQDFITACV
jgi:hypothetical protein